MDGEDDRLAVVRAGEHHLELELVELARQPGHPLGQFAVERAVAGLGGQLEEDVQIVTLAAELPDPRDQPVELGPLAE
jgi:hypothetical protein